MIEGSSDSPREKCGIVGSFLPGYESSRVAFQALFDVQHRGQESSGIATSDGVQMFHKKGMGQVVQVFQESDFKHLPGHISIGHNRYSTSGESTLAHAQPVIDDGQILALAHNGNLPVTDRLEDFLDSQGIQTNGLNDSELAHRAMLSEIKRGASLEEAVYDTYNLLDGAFSLILMTKNKLAAVRDRHGIRPLAMAKLNGGHIFASESCAFDTNGAQFMQEIEPGSMVTIEDGRIKCNRLATPDPKLDIFEFIYFSMPNSVMYGQRVSEVRRRCGISLASEQPSDADIVIPVLDSAQQGAEGFSLASGIPIIHGLIKHRGALRTFIQPEPHLRSTSVQRKFTSIPEVLKGKKAVIVDDSLVRGTTMTEIVKMVYQASGIRPDVRILSPMVLYPDLYGIDTKQKSELMAAMMTLEEMTRRIKSASLGFLSLEALMTATRVREKVSGYVFDGNYPTRVKLATRELARSM